MILPVARDLSTRGLNLVTRSSADSTLLLIDDSAFSEACPVSVVT